MKVRSILTALVLGFAAATRAMGQLISSPEPIAFTELVGAIRERGDPLEADGWDKVLVAYATYLDGCEALRIGPASKSFILTDDIPIGSFDTDFRREISDRQRRVRPQRLLDEALVAAIIENLPERS